ncbi:hypothetical protein S1OALGB6SA_590 [Olavius algarvensis spirochete endosymbiont]|nr:hypothetical protein S1OALGB6SA_590 [Olavius algarvensis spirochete endosymbiont]
MNDCASVLSFSAKRLRPGSSILDSSNSASVVPEIYSRLTQILLLNVCNYPERQERITGLFA